MKQKLKKTIVKHLKEDVKGYDKERKYLKKEAKEDKELIKKVKKSTKRKTNGKKK